MATQRKQPPVNEAARKRLQRERAEKERRVQKILAEIAKLPILDTRPIDEMLYDKDGLPK